MTRPLMLFAAGLGTRMGALTAQRPKPLIPVAGRPLIDHALALATPDLAAPIVVNVHYLGAQIRAHLRHRPDIRFADESAQLLETGGGLKAALPLLGPGPVFTLNSDAIWAGPNPLALLAAAWNPARMDGLLLLLPREAAQGHKGAGDFHRSPEGQLMRGHGPGSFIYLGAQIVNPDGLATIPARVFSLNLLWDQMLARGRLFGLLYPGAWCDVGSPEGLTAAEALLASERPS